MDDQLGPKHEAKKSLIILIYLQTLPFPKSLLFWNTLARKQPKSISLELENCWKLINKGEWLITLHFLPTKSLPWKKGFPCSGPLSPQCEIVLEIIHCYFWFLSWFESQSKPSYKPSPLVAHVAWIYQLRFLKEWRPSLSVISAAFMALGRSWRRKNIKNMNLQYNFKQKVYF